MDAKDRAGARGDRAGVVARVGPIRRPDLDQFRARASQDVGDAEATTDLDELTARDDDLLARRERGERKQDGGGVVVHHAAVLGLGQVGDEPARVTVSLPPLSGDEVVLDAHRAGRVRDGRDRAGRQRGSAEVGLEDDTGRVDDAEERRPVAVLDQGSRPRGERLRVPRFPFGPSPPEDLGPLS